MKAGGRELAAKERGCQYSLKNALKSPVRSATTRHMTKVVMFLPSAETKTLDSSFGARA